MSAQPAAAALAVAPTMARRDRLTALFDAHYDRLYRLGRRLSANRDEALDLVQETFLRAARASGTIPAESPDEEAWLVRILVNIRRDQWRKAGRRTRHAAEILEARPYDRGPEAGVIAKATVWRALERLTPRRRAVLIMHELEELDVRAIAATLGVSAVTVRWHLAVGRRELARLLDPTLRGTHADD
jgi:RNA polymerase sigma-70 factor (ECF subfamily)